jgi:hypothetical protein
MMANKPGFRIKDVWAFTAIDNDDEEGVIGQLMPNGTWMPFVCSDEKRVEALMPMAEKLASITGPIRLLHFSNCELVEEIH